MSQFQSSMRETENYLRRQQQVHRGIYEDGNDLNIDGNEPYLYRRQLNIEELQDIPYLSDEEEKKYFSEVAEPNAQLAPVEEEKEIADDFA